MRVNPLLILWGDGSRCNTRLLAANWKPAACFQMDALVEKLDARLRSWKPETAAAKGRLPEMIELADCRKVSSRGNRLPR
jgi:hypothetical protein